MQFHLVIQLIDKIYEYYTSSILLVLNDSFRYLQFCHLNKLGRPKKETFYVELGVYDEHQNLWQCHLFLLAKGHFFFILFPNSEFEIIISSFFIKLPNGGSKNAKCMVNMRGFPQYCIVWVRVGNIKTPVLPREICIPPIDQEGECDVVGICRALCLQPDLPCKLLWPAKRNEYPLKSVKCKLCSCAFVVTKRFAHVSVCGKFSGFEFSVFLRRRF